MQRLIRGIKRFHGERDRNPKLPITLRVLITILENLVTTSTNPTMLRGAFTTAFAGFLRCGEFTLKAGERFDPTIHLTWGSVTFIPNIDNATHVQLTLPSSKTDPFRKGVCIILAAAPGRISCPVDGLREMFRADSDASPESPLFHQRGSNEPLRRKFFIDAVQTALRAAGFDARKYSGHSFRRGAASSAAAAGYSDYEIQLLGRWRSDAYKLYLDVPATRILQLSSLLHVAQTHSAAPIPPAFHGTPSMA